jgi:NMD protein affecting ribosome stability and mRNA decay
MSLVKCPQCGRNVDTDKEEMVWCEFTHQHLCEDCDQENADEAEEMEEDLDDESEE